MWKTVIFIPVFLYITFVYLSGESVIFIFVVSCIQYIYCFSMFFCPIGDDALRFSCNNSFQVATEQFSNIPHLFYITDLMS